MFFSSASMLNGKSRSNIEPKVKNWTYVQMQLEKVTNLLFYFSKVIPQKEKEAKKSVFLSANKEIKNLVVLHWQEKRKPNYIRFISTLWSLSGDLCAVLYLTLFNRSFITWLNVHVCICISRYECSYLCPLLCKNHIRDQAMWMKNHVFFHV